MRKSQVSSQFNWIFILIVGGFFLMMFFTMSTRQADVSERRISATALSGLNNIFQAARTGTSLSTTITVPEMRVDFTCEIISDNIYSDYSVDGFTTRIDEMPTFAPGFLEGTSINTWTYRWEMPYTVMNFLYLSNPSTRIFFVFPEGEFEDLKKTINETFSSRKRHHFLESLDDVQDFNDDHTLIAKFTDGEMSNAPVFDHFNNDVRTINMKPYETDNRFGEADIYAKDGQTVSNDVPYLGLASLYGLIFSPDEEFYECSMKKAVRRLARISCIYYSKYKELEEFYQGEDLYCSNLYPQAIQEMEELFGDDFCDAEDLRIEEISKAESFKMEDYHSFFRGMSQANTGAREFSCEMLY